MGRWTYMPTRRMHPNHVWWLTAALALAAVVVVVLQLWSVEGFETVETWRMVAAVLGFALADAMVVRVRFRSETTAFSFFELPLFLAAFYIAPAMIVVAAGVGVAISVLFIQRLTPMKACFNIANLTFQSAIGLWIFHSIVGSADLEPASLGADAERASEIPVDPLGWLAAAVGGALSSTIGVLFLVVVLTMVQGYGAIAKAGHTGFMSAITGVTNVSLALLGATLINEQASALVLLIFPTLVLFGAYRAYTLEHAQRDRLQAVQELALEVRSIRDQAGVLPILRKIVENLGAQRASLVLFPEEGSGGDAMRFTVDGIAAKVSDVISGELAEVVDDVHQHGTVALRWAAERHSYELVGAIKGEGRPLGLLIVGDHVRGSAEFSEDDLLMFETIVEQLGLTFEKNELGDAVTRLEHRRRELQHKASHDALTGVANRGQLASLLTDALTARRTPSLLYIDIDDFKHINDRHGHDVGDQVLIELARRFTNVVGPTDCVARLGGDEFAVLLNGSSDDVSIAQLLLEATVDAIETDAGPVEAHVSIGLARADRTTDATALLKKADVAMYDAKARGKGTLALF